MKEGSDKIVLHAYFKLDQRLQKRPKYACTHLQIQSQRLYFTMKYYIISTFVLGMERSQDPELEPYLVYVKANIPVGRNACDL
jgi:hypothetical protein